MEPSVSPKKKLKSLDAISNSKTSITCSNVPEALFDATESKKHFTKFGRVHKIRLFPKRRMCIIEYDQPTSAERALLNAGAFEGAMFDVTRTKARIRKKSKKDDDPDWVPDSDLEEELAAMSGGPTHRVPRQKPMEVELPEVKISKPTRLAKQSPIRKKVPVREKVTITQPTSGVESPVTVSVVQTTMNTMEAAAELHQLRSRVSLTPDEQWRTLDARDRILRAWGGTGSRVKVGGATIGTCPDMCPEKELLHRQAEHQVLILETVVDSDGQMEPWRAVKQYSRSSADQEMPLCYELRPASVLMRTCSYLLYEIVDTKRQVTLSDWFHFMWDRLRSIRKDITQQALCCAESIKLVEMCARFHAHCGARLAGLQHSQFDPKLNTDNLAKCLQTLKHMYADVGPEHKPSEAEFRGYIALLNLGDANFWWEIKQLPENIQKSEAIVFAIKVFNAIDNNNYVRFFKLVHQKATYLQACILLRYFNDVRARALARIVKAYAPRGGSRFPAEDLMNALAFESVESMKSFINHYGLRFAKVEDTELTVILDRNQFLEDSDPYPIARAINLIESKRNSSVAEVIAGGKLPPPNYRSHNRYSSFNRDGRLKETALIAEDLAYNTVNDSNRDIESLKTEIQRLSQGGRIYGVIENKTNNNTINNIWSKPEMKVVKPEPEISVNIVKTEYLFQPAIPVAPKEILDKSPEKVMTLKDKSKFVFSKPQEPAALHVTKSNSVFSNANSDKNNIFGVLKSKSEGATAIFDKPKMERNNDSSSNIFSKGGEGIVKPDSTANSGNIFTKPVDFGTTNPSNIFSGFDKKSDPQAIFNEPISGDGTNFGQNASNKLSPGTLFKNACNTVNGSEPKAYSIFHTKNKENSVAADIFKSVNQNKFGSVYDFDPYQQTEEQMENDKKQKEEEIMIQEKLRKEAERKEEERKDELRRQEELRRQQEEMKRQEEKRRKEEERKREELKVLAEEKRKAELKRREEEDQRYRMRVDKESSELVEELVDEIKEEDATSILREEFDIFQELMSFSENLSEEIVTELCNEICQSEMMAEKYWTEKVMKKWFNVWKNQLMRNYKRRCFLENTPVWLTDKTPIEEAAHLRRFVEQSALKNMNAFHQGYRFTGQLKLYPSPEAYNVMEIIKSPLLKRMKYINYPYDKCFFWKVTLVAPRTDKWMCKKIDTVKWILDAFCDGRKHDASDSLIHVKKQSWNNLIDFAIAISLIWQKRHNVEAIEGTNGFLFYFTEFDKNCADTIMDTMKHKYSHQIVPVAIILPKMSDDTILKSIECILSKLLNDKIISTFKIYNIEPQNIVNSLNSCTKSSLKWIAKMYPQVPNLEVDLLKSFCQRYLGNEIWCRLKSERDVRVSTILKDIRRLVKCYNIAVEQLIEVVTNEDLFNYPPFPLEFKEFLDITSPYPKPYEFIPSSARNTENTSAVREMMKQLRLPDPTTDFKAIDVPTLQQQIRKYCKQIGWFKDPEEVVCKIVAVLPNQFSDLDMPCEEFTEHFVNYNLVDFLNIIVYEKINRLNDFGNRFVIYEPSVLQEYRNCHWVYETDVISRIKHRAIEYEDDIDYYLKAKRRKITLASMEYILEDKDATMVEENIKNHEESISKYNDCEQAVKQLEEKLEEEKQKSIQLEKLLRLALSDEKK
ncbi:uncharacterized protein xmas [Plodia interpunctella]|uniref:uncharacterized protein xmas n=1 Tax=Plodia interpunctella TaxID=58824 RepID=UPI002367BA33|nr:uncharacterized protein LOC128674780 [Plodia interpunctella]